MPLEIHQFSALQDNYSWLLHDPDGDGGRGVTAVVDTPEVEAVERALDATGWRLTHILNTHHHWDHAGGNEALKARFGVTVIGPKNEADKIPGLDRPVSDGDTVAFGTRTAKILDVPGHTAGHIAYWFPEDGVAFVGDTLFALGCGRLFEGTPAQMWNSLQKLMSLPPETTIYCAHEYTQANARFALTVEPGNEKLRARAEAIDAARARGEATVPTTLSLELETNPFLRPMSENLQATLGLQGAPLTDVFAETRRRKDNFR